MSDVILTEHATAKGGRDGHVTSSDKLIDLNLSMPGDGVEKNSSNPEQLFAAAYSSCFDGALNLVASKKNQEIDSETTADVSLLKDSSDNGFKIGVVLHVEVRGVSQNEAEALVDEAHKVCPYSKATSGNIDVQLKAKAV
ncbi:organic hydroperoxide resistance protein [Thalassobacillus sp. CUG 92003]|uniref:organic hydroperoxide resistance protein n=1 Tax=Thalassobacillus sp. CUG 92003 TaxID=2736641 RepID=UPI0015E64A28|nr:organic hydroperoxide resistance protein [Thalassobacillus sp. CUG 92003]